MSLYGLNPLADANLADRLDRLPAAPAPQPGFFAGSLTAGAEGIGEGVAKVAQFQADQQFDTAAELARQTGRNPNDILAEMMAGQQAGGMEAYGSYSEHPFGKLDEQTPEQFDASAKETSRKMVEQFQPDPGKVGTGGQILHGLTSMVTRATLGAAAGPVGAGLVVGATEKHSQFEELKAQGVDPGTAADVSTVTGIVSGLGAAIPGAYGKTLTARLTTGAAGNVALGGLSRGLTHEILDSAGYTDMAAQYRVLDAQSIAIDGVLGLAFGGVHHMFHVEPNEPPAASVVDGALAANEGLHAQIDTAPGIPATPEAMAAHHDNLVRGAEALMNDEPVGGLREIVAADRPLDQRAQAAHDEALAIARADAADVIGPHIPTAEEAASALAGRVSHEFAAARAEYEALPGSDGGRVLNTDLARELSPAYRADRTRSADVHEPASAFVKKLYAAKLKEMPKGSTILFTAGGTGAGKSTAIADAGLSDAHGLVYDTNMSTFEPARQKIDQALAAGHSVNVVYVFRDPIEALTHGALPRAMRMGRTVPIGEHIKTHVGAAETVKKLSEHYADNPRVRIEAVDNSRGRGKAIPMAVSDVVTLDHTTVTEKAHAALEAERVAGRISEAVHRGTASADANGAAVRGRAEPGRPEPTQEQARAEQARVVADLETSEAIQEARNALQGRSDVQVDDPTTGERIDASEAIQRAENAIADAADEGFFAQVAAACFGRG